MTEIKPNPVNFDTSSPFTMGTYVNKETPNFYKGTSFRGCKDWTKNRLYSGDAYYIDCVLHNGKMWACTKSHYSTVAPSLNSEYGSPTLDPRTVAIHVGDTAPTEESHGSNFYDLIGLDTSSEEDDTKVYTTKEVDNLLELLKKEILQELA